MVNFRINIQANPGQALAGIKRVDQALINLRTRANALRGLINASLAVNPAAATTGITSINQSLGRLQTRIAAVQASMAKGFVVNSTGAERGLNRIGTSARGANAAVSTLQGTLIRTFAIFGGVALIRSGLSSMIDFSEAIRTAGVVAGATANELDALKNRARELGATTRFTAVEAAQGLATLSRAGFDVAESLDTIGNTLDLAVAGGLGLAQATDIAVGSLRGFGIAAKDSGRVVDTIAGAANNANTSVREMGQAISFVAPIASSLGISIEQVAASLGILGDSSIKASRGGTSLRILFASLKAPTVEAKKVLDEMSKSVGTIDIEANGLVKTFTQLRDAGLDTTNVFQLFDRRGAAAALALTQNIDKFTQLEEKFNDNEGAAKAAAQAIDQSLLGALKRVQSAFAEIFLAIGDAGGEASFRKFLDGVADGLRFLGRSAETLLDIIEGLVTVIVVKLVGRAFKSIVVFLATNPFLALQRGILLATAAIIGFADKIIISSDGITSLEDVAITAFQAIQDFAIPVLQAIGNAISSVFGGPDTLSSISDFVEAGARGLDQVGQFFVAFGVVTVAEFQKLALTISTFFQRIFGTVSNIVSETIANLIGFFVRQLNTIISATAGLAAVARSLGVISEETRQNFETAVSDIERLGEQRAKGGADNQNLPWTKTDLEDLKRETLNTIAEIDRQTASSIRASAGATPFQNLLGNAENRAQERAALQRAEVARRAQEDAAKAAGQPSPVESALADLARLEEASNQASTTLAEGFSRAFQNIRDEANDFASVAESAVDSFADRATDALTTFAETGKLSFKDFARDIISDLTRVIARLLVVQAIQAAVGVVSPGSLVNTPATPGRASGGPVQPNRSFIVGEEGPELFTPNRGGNITPNDQMRSEPAQVTVVNVDDPSMVPAAIADGDADDVLLNFLSRNRDKVSRMMGK